MLLLNKIDPLEYLLPNWKKTYIQISNAMLEELPDLTTGHMDDAQKADLRSMGIDPILIPKFSGGGLTLKMRYSKRSKRYSNAPPSNQLVVSTKKK